MVKYHKPWMGTCWIKDRPIPKVPQICSSNGHTINKLQPMFDAFQHQFQPTLDGQADLAHPFLDALPSKASHPFAPFSLAELLEVLGMCLMASAPGPSHMSWSLLKLFLADLAFQDQFLKLANDIVLEGVWPSTFKTSITVVIPKLHKDDYTLVKNFRPITLLECAGKLISKLIAARLQSDAVHFNLVHPLQFGRLKYRSTIDAGFFLMEYITKAHNMGCITSALALDIAQFFPSLRKEVILFMMCKLGFDPQLCALLSSYYDEYSTKYLWNIFFSKDFNANNGVPQGNPLSPIISILYLSLVLKSLFPSLSNSISCLSFIDDFVLVVNNIHICDNIVQLEAAFTQLDDVLSLTLNQIRLNLCISLLKLKTLAGGTSPSTSLPFSPVCPRSPWSH